MFSIYYKNALIFTINAVFDSSVVSVEVES